MKRRPIEAKFDPLPSIREHIRKQTYLVKPHATKRQNERLISAKDTLYVLKNGVHEEEKSGFDVKRQTWKYAVRGKTLDGIELRVIVAFLPDKMAIITVMALKKRTRL